MEMGANSKQSRTPSQLSAGWGALSGCAASGCEALSDAPGSDEAAGVLCATYLIGVLFNGFDWPGWQEGWRDLKNSAKILLEAVEAAFGQLEDSTPDGLVLDPPAGGEVGRLS